MNDSIPVTIPLVNPNEPEALLAALHVQEGQKVSVGDPICTLETTKSTAEVGAEAGGYILGLRFWTGQTVFAQDVLCYIATSPDWQPPAIPPVEATVSSQIPEGLRITQPALELALRIHFDLDRLPHDQLVTEKTILAVSKSEIISDASGLRTEADTIQPAFDPAQIIFYGAGGHGKTLVELVRAMGIYRISGVIDDDPEVTKTLLGIPILGGAGILEELYNEGIHLAVNAVGGIGNLPVRMRVFQRLHKAGFSCPVVVHPRAVIEPSAQLSAGVQVFAQAYVGSDVRIGYGAIINTGAIVSHDCILGDYVNISPGAILAGGVHVGRGALVGMGATLNLNVEVGEGARIGNGATVKASVPDGGVVRAGTIWPEK